MDAIKRASAAGAAIALAALSAFFVMPRLDALTSKAVAQGVLELRSRLESGLGLNVSFDSLSPSIIRSASFSGLSISAPGGRTLLVAKKVTASYNLFALLRGRPSEALTGLELQDVTVDLRVPEDKSILDRLASASEGRQGSVLPKILVTGKNVSARVTIDGRMSASFDAREISFSNRRAEPEISLDGSFAVEGAAQGLGEVRGPLSLTGSLARDFSKARLELSVAAQSRLFSLAIQRFELVYGDGKLALTKVKDRSPLDAEFELDLAGGESRMSLLMDGFVPARSVSLGGTLAGLDPWLKIPYKGSIEASLPDFDVSRLAYSISLSGALPAGMLTAVEGSAYAELSARGDMKSVTVEKARLERGKEGLQFSGSFGFEDLSPNGTLDIDMSLAGGSIPFSSSVRLEGHDGEYTAQADEARIGGVVFRDLALAAARKGQTADFSLSLRPPQTDADSGLAAQGFSGEAGSQSGSPLVKAEGSIVFGDKTSLELSADLEAIDLAPLEPLIERLNLSPQTAALLASFKLGGSLFATSDLERISWTASDLTLVTSAVPGAYAILSLSGNATSVAVKHALVSAFGLSFEGAGKADFSEAGRLAFEATLSYNDIPYAVKGSLEGDELLLSGNYGLEVAASLGSRSDLVDIKAEGLPIPLLGGVFLATVDASGRYESADSWSLSVADLAVVPEGESMASVPDMELSGSFGPSSAALSRLIVKDRTSALEGKASLSYSLTAPFGATIQATLSAAGKGSPESYAVSASYSGGIIDARADFVASPLARLGKLPVAGSVDGSLAARGDPADPSLDFSLRLRDGRYLNQTLVAAVSGGYSGQKLELRELSAAYQGQAIRSGSASFSIADASSSVSLVFSGSLLDSSLGFSLSAHGLSAAPGAPTLEGKLEGYSLSGAMGDFKWGTLAASSWPFKAAAASKAVSIVSGSSGELRATLSSGGSFSASLRSPFPVLAEVTGLYDGANIDLSVEGLAFDLGILSPLMPPDLIRIVSGRAQGGFRATGLAGDPEISGQIDCKGASLKVLGWLADAVGPFDASLVATGRSLYSVIPAVRIGKATAAAQFQATFDQWLPTGLTASVATVPGSVVSLDASILGIRAKATAAASLKFALQGDVLGMDCDVALVKGSVVVSPAVLNQAPASPERPSVYIAVSTNVHVGRGVEVFFPSTDIPVIAAYSDPSSLLAVHFDQESGDFTLMGSVALRGGEVFYIQRNFFLRSGRMVFNENSERFEPRVTLLAELRDRDEQGDPVTISLKTDNAPLSSFQPSLSSDPPMTASQIAVLMGQNLFGASTDNSVDIRKTVISGTQFIPQLDITRRFIDLARDSLGLDFITVRTQVLQNWLYDIAMPASATGDVVGRYFDQSELYVGKYLTDSIFTHASLLFNDDPLAGYYKPELDSELGVELDTPFGLIQWNLDPKHWDDLLISDQSLSISWKLSY